MDNPLDFGYDRQIVIDQHHIIVALLKSSPGMCFREWGVGLQLAELALKIENTNTISSQTMVYKLHYCTH